MLACTSAQMRDIDRRAVSEFGIPSLLLMENAGAAVADRVMAHVRPGRAVLVLCGRGNNGGDGFAAARRLHCRGVAVRCLLFGEEASVAGDARVNLDLARAYGVPVEAGAAGDAGAGPDDVVVDALLGTGISGEVRGPIADGIRIAARHAGPVIAVDVPSGLNADTGAAGTLCVRATETVTFGLPKVGLLVYPGRALAGRVTVAEIGLPPGLLGDSSLDTAWLTAAEVRPLWPPRSATAHKGDGGRLLVVAGSGGMVGAGVLAAEAALRAGAGLVTLAVPAGIQPTAAGMLPEAMTLPLPETAGGGLAEAAAAPVIERLSGADALVVGPGLGRDPATGAMLRRVLAAARLPLVADADALNLLAPAVRGDFPDSCVLTPHPGELARLIATTVEGVQSDRLAAARVSAARCGCTVVLKGAGTVIASPGERTWINSTGGPALATAGTGDVLAGVLGACLARGLPPAVAALAAVYIHGLAGDIAGELCGAPGALAGDVIRALPAALRRLAQSADHEPGGPD